MPQSRAFPMPAPLVSPLLAACAAALGLAAATLGAQSIPVLFAQTPAAPAPAAVPVSEAAPVVVQRDDDGLFMVVGDVNGRMLLAHAASHQAHYVVERLLGHTARPYASGPVPSILYGAPEVFRAGIMAEEAKALGSSVLVSRAQLIANPIAQAHAATAGFVKCVWRDGKIAGITAVGAGVSRLACFATLIIQQGWTREDASGFMFPHPTLDESLKAALLADKEAV